MKNYQIILLLIPFLFGLAVADLDSANVIEPGEILTLTTEVPEGCKVATFALGGEARGLLMKPSVDGDLKGEFAVLPSMAGRVLTPVITYHMTDGSIQTETQDSLKVLDSRAKSGNGFLTESNDGELIFVFDQTIRMKSVVVKTTEGDLTDIDYEQNFFRLPSGLDGDDIVSIRATSIDGTNLRIENGFDA